MDTTKNGKGLSFKVFAFVFLFLIIGLIVSGSNSVDNQQTKDIPESKSQNQPGYQKKTIAELIPGSDTGTLIDTQGIVTQKSSFTYKSNFDDHSYKQYYMRLKDKDATVLIQSQTDSFGKYKIGETIQVKGGLGRLGDDTCSSTQQDKQMLSFCNIFGIKSQKNPPVIIPVEISIP